MLGVKNKTKTKLVRALTSFSGLEPGAAYELPAAQAAEWIRSNLVREIVDDFEINLAHVEIRIRNDNY